MNAPARLFVWIATVAAGFTASAAEEPKLDSRLEPLRGFLGKTWKGHFKNSTPEKPVVDVARWERALNGKAVRILHSVNDGAYGGETIVRWDSTREAVRYHYFTTAGFRTTGTMTFKDGKIFTHEVITGGTSSVTEVKGTTELRPDGTFIVKTEHLKGGEWTPGRETTYREDPAAKVVFQ
jgi:hypothetical protein